MYNTTMFCKRKHDIKRLNLIERILIQMALDVQTLLAEIDSAKLGAGSGVTIDQVNAVVQPIAQEIANLETVVTAIADKLGSTALAST